MSALSVESGLTQAAARALTDEVKADAAALWGKLLALYEGGAHAVLGYSSWGTYFEEEFGQSGAHGYRLLDSARVLDALPAGDSPIGESVTRQLVPVLRRDPEAVEEVWAEVVEEYGSAPTAAQVREVVQRNTKENQPVGDVLGKSKPKSTFSPGTKRYDDISRSHRDRINELIWKLDGYVQGLPTLRVDMAIGMATDDELREWNDVLTRARSALLDLRNNLNKKD